MFMPTKRITSKRLLIYLLLLVFLIIAYLPLSSFLFALKNDALTINFPNKYFFSAAVHSGYLPLWNPYVNFGFPLHADPGFAFWNPLTWMFGCIGYSIPVLSIEILFYIWVAGISSFELGIWLGHSQRVSFCIGVIFMSCGFFVGNLQHTNFLTCAAFLPFVIITYLDLHRAYTGRKYFFCLLSLYMMATSGHPAIPVASIYFLLLIQTGLIIFNEKSEKKKKVLLNALCIDLKLLAGFLLLSAPLIYSYFEIYPHFTRASSVNQSSLYDTGFDLSSYLSFIFPLAVSGKNFLFNNDLLMRNGYFSITAFVCFIMILFSKKNKYQKIFLMAGTGMLLLSLGGQIKETVYSILPLLEHIRTNGEFRVFSILSFILTGAYMMEHLINGIQIRLFNQLLLIIIAVCFIIIIGWLLLTPSDSIIFRYTESQPADFLNSLKLWMHRLTFSDRLILNACLLLVLVGLYFLGLNKMNRKTLIPLFIITDMILFCWTNLPVTGVQIKSPALIQSYLSGVPKGIPVPDLTPVGQNRFLTDEKEKTLGCGSYYYKQPGTPYFCNYPSVLNMTVEYFRSSLPDSLNSKPFVFTKGDLAGEKLKINAFSPSGMHIIVETEKSDSLILLQNAYFRWRSTVNGKSVPISRTGIAFMSVPLQKGLNEVSFSYDSRSLLMITLADLLLWIFFSLAVFRPEFFYFIRNIFP